MDTTEQDRAASSGEEQPATDLLTELAREAGRLAKLAEAEQERIASRIDAHTSRMAERIDGHTERSAARLQEALDRTTAKVGEVQRAFESTR